MPEGDPTVQTLKLSEARRQFSQVLNRVFKREARVIVEKSGIPVAAIVSTHDLERLDQLEADRANRFRALDATRDAFKNIPDEVLEAEVTKAVAAARSELRKERSA